MKYYFQILVSFTTLMQYQHNNDMDDLDLKKINICWGNIFL